MDYLLPNPFVLPMVIRQDTVRVRLSYAELLPFDFGDWESVRRKYAY